MKPLPLVWFTGFFWLGLITNSLSGSLLVALIPSTLLLGWYSQLYKVCPKYVSLAAWLLGLWMAPIGPDRLQSSDWQSGSGCVRVLGIEPQGKISSRDKAGAATSSFRMRCEVEEIRDRWNRGVGELKGRRVLLILPIGEYSSYGVEALRWEIAGEFKVGSSGGVRFKVHSARPIVKRGLGDVCRLYLIRSSMAWREYLKRLTQDQSQKSMGRSLMLSMLGAERSSARVDYILNRLGINHLTAISGLHFALVSGLALLLLRSLAMPIRLAGVVFLSSLFLLLSGPSSSSLRAWMMNLLAMGCLLTGRRYEAIQALALSASIWLAIYPHWAVQPGFILSVYCTAILIAMAPLLRGCKSEGKGGWLRFWSWIQPWIILQGALFLFLAPLQLYWFHSLGWLSILANIAMAPLLAGCFTLALVGAISGFLIPPLGSLIMGLASDLSDLLLSCLCNLPHRLDQTWDIEIGSMGVALGMLVALTAWLKLLYLETERIDWGERGGESSSESESTPE